MNYYDKQWINTCYCRFILLLLFIFLFLLFPASKTTAAGVKMINFNVIPRRCAAVDHCRHQRESNKIFMQSVQLSGKFQPSSRV